MRHSWDVSFCLLQAFLENEDLGNSLGSVEALRQKHDDFEEAFTAQEEKITVRNGPWFGDWLHFFFFSTLQYCIGFAIYQNDSATSIHVNWRIIALQC